MDGRGPFIVHSGLKNRAKLPSGHQVSNDVHDGVNPAAPHDEAIAACEVGTGQGLTRLTPTLHQPFDLSKGEHRRRPPRAVRERQPHIHIAYVLQPFAPIQSEGHAEAVAPHHIKRALPRADASRYPVPWVEHRRADSVESAESQRNARQQTTPADSRRQAPSSGRGQTASADSRRDQGTALPRKRSPYNEPDNGGCSCGMLPRMDDPSPFPWPVTIMRSRYGGIYEPGRWIAFPQVPAGIPR